MEFRIIHLTETDSTNPYLHQLYIDNQAVEGTVITAGYQHAGKGQDTNIWYSSAGKNLLMSVLLTPAFLPAQHQFLLNQCLAVSLRETVARYVQDSDVTIKWPNDIYVGNQKIAGILIRHFISGSTLEATIAGIGLNVQEKDFPEFLPNPCSIYTCSGILYPPMDVLQSLLEQINHHYENLRNQQSGFVESAYQKHLFRRELMADYRINGVYCTARITGTDEYGRLKLTDSQGKVMICDLKEIQYVI